MCFRHKLVGQYINLEQPAKGKGKVTDYQDLVELHTIKFESSGASTMNLQDGNVKYQIMSEKFVELFVGRIVKEWEAERKEKRAKIRAKARQAANDEMDSWIPGDITPELKGQQIDVRGKGRGVVKAVNGTQVSVLFDKDVEDHKEALRTDPETPAPETRPVDGLKTKFRVKDNQFVRMFVNNYLKQEMMKEAAEKRAEWQAEDGDSDAEDQKTLTQIVDEEVIRVFGLLDVDGGGEIDREEIATMRDIVGIDFTDQELDQLFDEIDEDGGGEVDMVCMMIETQMKTH